MCIALECNILPRIFLNNYWLGKTRCKILFPPKSGQMLSNPSVLKIHTYKHYAKKKVNNLDAKIMTF